MAQGEAQFREMEQAIDKLERQYTEGMAAAADIALDNGDMHHRYAQTFEAVPGSPEEEVYTQITIAALDRVKAKLMPDTPDSGVSITFDIQPEQHALAAGASDDQKPQSYVATMKAAWALDEAF